MSGKPELTSVHGQVVEPTWYTRIPADPKQVRMVHYFEVHPTEGTLTCVGCGQRIEHTPIDDLAAPLLERATAPAHWIPCGAPPVSERFRALLTTLAFFAGRASAWATVVI